MHNSNWVHLSENLEHAGWSECADFLTQSQCAHFLTEAKNLKNLMHKAGAGRGGTFQAHSVRGDSTLWLDLADPMHALISGILDGIRLKLNSELF